MAEHPTSNHREMLSAALLGSGFQTVITQFSMIRENRDNMNNLNILPSPESHLAINFLYRKTFNVP